MSMPVTQMTQQPVGILHGGATVALAESAASIGTWLGIDRTAFSTVGLEINCNHLRAKRDGTVWAIATRCIVADATGSGIFVYDEADALIAISRCTLAVDHSLSDAFRPSLAPDSVLFVEDRHVELAETRGIGDDLDGGDLPICNSEAEGDTRLSTLPPNRPHGAVDERQSRGVGASHKLPRHRLGAVCLAGHSNRDAHRHNSCVGAEGDVGIERGKQRGEVAVA